MLTVSTQLAQNEDLAQFGRMLNSIKNVDEINIYNFGRLDKEFLALCKQYQAKVIDLKQPYPPIVEYIRATEITSAKYDWVLLLDYDEIVTPALLREIIHIVTSPVTNTVYALPRRNFSLSHPLRHGGFGDDNVIRLFYKPAFISWSKEIHSTPKFKGDLAVLASHLEHHKDASLEQMVTKTNRYTNIEARQFFLGNTPQVTSLTILRKTIMEFLRRYFLKLGFLDGRIGLIQSLYQSYSIFLRYAKIYELQLQKEKA